MLVGLLTECERNMHMLQARVQSVNQVLFGWFTIPDAIEVPLDFNINPLGNRMRSEKRVWNDGKQRLKLVCALPVLDPARE